MIDYIHPQPAHPDGAFRLHAELMTRANVRVETAVHEIRDHHPRRRGQTAGRASQVGAVSPHRFGKWRLFGMRSHMRGSLYLRCNSRKGGLRSSFG